MILEGVISTLLGGAMRALPEWLGNKKAKQDNEHELNMLQLQIQLEQVKHKSQVETYQVQNDGALALAEMEALKSAIQAQGQMTGVKWIDGLNQLIRPLMALQWVIILYPTVVISRFWLMVEQNVPALEAVQAAWTENEMALVLAIAGFFLVNRSIEKKKGAA